jgi:hypothetical protein
VWLPLNEAGAEQANARWRTTLVAVLKAMLEGLTGELPAGSG